MVHLAAPVQERYAHTHPGVYKHFLRGVPLPPDPVRDRVITDWPIAVKPEIVEPPPAPKVEEIEDEAMTLPARRQEKLKKAEARRESRKRKLERLRA